MTAVLAPPPTLPAAQPVAAPPQEREKVARQPAAPVPDWAKAAIAALLTVTFLALWTLVYALLLSGWQEGRSQRVLYTGFRQQIAAETAPLGGTVAPQTPVALLTIPALGLQHAVVVEGTSSRDLTKGPGHLRDSVLPGQPGYSFLFGRSVTFGAPFQHLATLRPGSTITTVTQQGTFVYTVDRVRHLGDKGSPGLPTGQSRLVLVSSEGSGGLGGLTPSKPVYVDASLKGKPVPGPGGVAPTVPAGELALGHDTGSLVGTVLGLQALAVVLVGIGALAVRWSRSQTWAVAVPTILAALWWLSSNAFQLLPNLF